MNKIIMCFVMAFALFGLIASVSALQMFDNQANKSLFMNKNSVSVTPARDPTSGLFMNKDSNPKGFIHSTADNKLIFEMKPKGYIHTTTDNKIILEIQPKPNDYRKLMKMTPKPNSDYIHTGVLGKKQAENKGLTIWNKK